MKLRFSRDLARVASLSVSPAAGAGLKIGFREVAEVGGGGAVCLHGLPTASPCTHFRRHRPKAHGKSNEMDSSARERERGSEKERDGPGEDSSLARANFQVCGTVSIGRILGSRLSQWKPRSVLPVFARLLDMSGYQRGVSESNRLTDKREERGRGEESSGSLIAGPSSR